MAMAPMAVIGANVVVNVDGRGSLMCASLETKRRTSLWRGRARGKIGRHVASTDASRTGHGYSTADTQTDGLKDDTRTTWCCCRRVNRSIIQSVPCAMSRPATTVNADGSTQHAWEDAGGEQTWESAVREDEDGNIILAGGHETSADAIRMRRKRLEQNDYSQKRKRVVRDMIRYIYVLVDASRWMREKDPVLPPGTRLDATLKMLQQFVQEYFDQNPLSHLGFIVLRNGEAEILTQLSSNSKAHKVALQSFGLVAASEPPSKGGEFSLQNGLEVAGRSLGHQPRHGSREIVVVAAALSTCDPGNILTETLPRLQVANIRVSAFALAAELHVCRKLAEETNGVMGVCLDKAHFRDWLLSGQCVPPPAHKRSQQETGCEMVRMGFPTRTTGDVPTLVHATRDTKILARTAYLCPQCKAKASALPTDCTVCGLKLVLAPHLARSFHHLFPVPAFADVPIDVFLSASTIPSKSLSDKLAPVSSGTVLPQKNVYTLDSSMVCRSKEYDRCCFSCLKLIGTIIPSTSSKSSSRKSKGNSKNSNGNDEKQQGSRDAPDEEILRFQCPNCKNVFCADCDALLHETLHNCPGCLGSPKIS